MVSVKDMEVEEVAEGEPVTVNVGQTLSKVRYRMEENGLRTVPVVDGERFEGMLSYRDVMEKSRSDPSTIKLDDLVHTPPKVEGDENLVELSRLRIESGRKKFAMVGEHDRLEGVIGEFEIVEAAVECEELEGVTVADVMTSDLVTVEADEPFDTARNRMMEYNISRLVVLEDGELQGIITSLDTLRSMVPRDQMQGGSKHHAARSSASGDVQGEKESMSDIPVRELMQPATETLSYVIEGEDTPLRETVRHMLDNELLEVVVVEDGDAAGILTLKDVVDLVAGHEVVESLLVQLTGPEVPREKQAILDKIENQVRGGLGRVLDRPDELRVHVKKYEKDGKRHKYTLNFRLSSKLGTLRVNTHGWDLLDAVDEGLENLERLVKEEKEKTRDQQRERRRKGKYSG